MSLNQLPESSDAPKGNILSHSLLMALALALSACDKPHTAQPEAAPAIAPTGAITDMLFDGLPDDIRRDFAQRLIAETLGTTGGDFYQRGFSRDPENASAWHIHELATGFGPSRGTHIVTVKREGETTHVNDMADWNNDGIPDEVSLAVSSPVPGSEGKMMHRDTSFVVDGDAKTNYISAVCQALAVLEAEKDAKEKEQK
jgi:hypothetical protein